jgi:hypothetical protein
LGSTNQCGKVAPIAWAIFDVDGLALHKLIVLAPFVAEVKAGEGHPSQGSANVSLLVVFLYEDEHLAHTCVCIIGGLIELDIRIPDSRINPAWVKSS